jgi:hypothetical protein
MGAACQTSCVATERFDDAAADHCILGPSACHPVAGFPRASEHSPIHSGSRVFLAHEVPGQQDRPAARLDVLTCGKGICICLAAVACSERGTGSQAWPDAQGLPDVATVPVDEANPRCAQPWDGSPTDGGLFDEADAFEAEGSSPLVAMDEQGNGIVVWSVRCGDENRALARRRRVDRSSSGRTF